MPEARVRVPPVAPRRSVRQRESRGLQNRGCRFDSCPACQFFPQRDGEAGSRGLHTPEARVRIPFPLPDWDVAEREGARLLPGRSQVRILPSQPACPSSSGKDAGSSSRRREFESRRTHHRDTGEHGVPASLGRRRSLVQVQLSRPVGHSSRGEHGVVIPEMRVRVPLATPPARGETDDHGRLRTCSRRFESSRADQMRTELEGRAAGCRPEGCGFNSRRPRQAFACDGRRKGGRAAEGARPENGIPSGDVSSNLTPSSRLTSGATGSAPGPEPGGAGSTPAS